MSFRDLKKLFDDNAEQIDGLDPFRKLYLRSLFELNGNVDTIALCQRALVELADKHNIANAEAREKLQKETDRMVELLVDQHEMLESLKRNPMEVNGKTKNTRPKAK